MIRHDLVDVELYEGDALDVLAALPTDAVDACVTSPPYLDARPEYPSPSPERMAAILLELRRVVAGPLLVNVGRLFRGGRERLWWLELVDGAERAGWPHRDTLVWAKENPNPLQGAIVADAHEYVLAFGDGFDVDAVRTEYAPGSVERLRRRWISSVTVKGDSVARNGPRRDVRRGERREPNPAGARPSSVFVCPTGREKGNPHPAPMPLELAVFLVALAGGATVLDPFAGSGTTAAAARLLERRAILVEQDHGFAELALRRLSQLRVWSVAP